MRFKALISVPGEKKQTIIYANDKASIRTTIGLYPAGSKVKLFETQDVLIEAFTVEGDPAPAKTV